MNNILSILGSIKNPQQFLTNTISNNPNMKNNPIMQNALNLYNAGDINALKNMANNICKERGMNPEDIMRSIGMK